METKYIYCEDGFDFIKMIMAPNRTASPIRSKAGSFWGVFPWVNLRKEVK
jgi:hypothetical protein